ncbi:MAG: 50S ribosomal protein L11 methyltransferase, partial [Limisphaerales bacterium]
MRTKPESLRRISVMTTPEAEDAVAEFLSAVLNLPASAYFDIETGVSTVTVYFHQKSHLPRKLRAEISAGLRRIKSCGLKIGPGKIVIAKVRRENWAESWKRHFKPIEIVFKNQKDEPCEPPASCKRLGTRITRPSENRPSEELGQSLLIKPSWSKRKARKGQAEIVLDPGLSFGTGHHPTTAFCLSEIGRFQKGGDSAPRCPDGPANRPHLKPPSFLDLGTGSGILAIAAAKLGYSPVFAMDFDPEAVHVARTNAHANRVRQKLEIRRADVTNLPVRPRRQYDLVCANLISTLLITARRRIAAQLHPAGTLVLAGILKSEFREVRKAYKTLGLRLVSLRDEKEWCSGSFRSG